MIEKKYCNDFASNISFLDYEVKENRIICEIEGYSLYNIFLWQQELINKLLKKHTEVILEMHFVNFDFVKEVKLTRPIEIWQGRNCSYQCCYCLNRGTCNEYSGMLDKDFKMTAKNDEQLYNLYLQVEANASGLNDLKDDIRKQIDAKIEENKGVLELKQLGLNLKIQQITKDSFPVKKAIEHNLLDEKTCSVKIGEMRKKIAGKQELEKHIVKVPFQKKLVIE